MPSTCLCPVFVLLFIVSSLASAKCLAHSSLFSVNLCMLSKNSSLGVFLAMQSVAIGCKARQPYKDLTSVLTSTQFKDKTSSSTTHISGNPNFQVRSLDPQLLETQESRQDEGRLAQARQGPSSSFSHAKKLANTYECDAQVAQAVSNAMPAAREIWWILVSGLKRSVVQAWSDRQNDRRISENASASTKDSNLS